MFFRVQSLSFEKLSMNVKLIRLDLLWRDVWPASWMDDLRISFQQYYSYIRTMGAEAGNKMRLVYG